MSDQGLTKHIFFWRRRIEIGCVVFREISRTPGSIGGGAYIVSEGVESPRTKGKRIAKITTRRSEQKQRTLQH